MLDCIETTPLYPFGEEIGKILRNSFPSSMNFSLWYNKFVPVAEWNFNPNRKHKPNIDCHKKREKYEKDITKNTFKVCDAKGETEEVIEFYATNFQHVDNKTLSGFLSNKHNQQKEFCANFSTNFLFVEIKARLVSPMVVGIGEMHPSETSMIFDRNLGIPYIPASSIKGVVRFAKLLEMIEEAIREGNTDVNGKGKEIVVLEKLHDYNSFVDLFGGDREKGGKTQSFKGKVIFLDAYPKEVPELAVDIMNSHYGDYYSAKKDNNNNPIPPSDNQNPNPVKFLVVAKGTEFIFRILVSKQVENLKNEAEKVLKKALTEEGIGAKTSLGYGQFELVEENSENTIEKHNESSPISHIEEDPKAKILRRLKETKKGDYNRIDELFRDWQNNEDLKNDKEIAEDFKSKVKKTRRSGKYTSHYKTIAKILGETLEE